MLARPSAAGDLTAAIGELKARLAGELQVHGSGALIRWLLENDLVDEITLRPAVAPDGLCTALKPSSSGRQPGLR